MPIYEYLCENCGHLFEEMQTMKEESLITCPKCGHDTLKRLIGAGSGFIFKGSGFYLTDYKNKKSSHKDTPANKTSDDSSKKETTKKESKKDTKPGKKE
ncbi:MAG: zinc ribbon domain-containing protein [Ignavibacteriae bacterium]|nr:MAG: zinc ribbon domain-containing protein [Ignavibacteriota bacterium]